MFRILSSSENSLGNTTVGLASLQGDLIVLSDTGIERNFGDINGPSLYNYLGSPTDSIELRQFLKYQSMSLASESTCLLRTRYTVLFSVYASASLFSPHNFS